MIAIEWAPLKILPRRRLQTLTAGIFMCILFGLGLYSHVICVILFFYGNIYVKTLLVVYSVWIYCDRDRAQNCIRGSGVSWMRDNSIWKLLREYFPVELVKTADLPPDRNYLLACFPHGILSFGLFVNICSDISKWNELFPKVRVHMATLALSFNTPFWREFLQAWGIISVTKKSLLNNLTTSNDAANPMNNDGYSATAVGVVVGGLEEALNAKPGRYILNLKNRKGFIKVAIQSGAAIVPVFSFGENEIFDQIDNPHLRKFQTFMKQKTGFPPMIILGRGFFQYTFGFLPHRRRIVQVVGAPIEISQCDNPKEEDVEKIHKLFVDSLISLFETHKSKYIKDFDNAVLVLK